MAKSDYYTINEDKDNFICIKMDPDTHAPKSERNEQGTPNQYKIGKQGGNAAMCDCYAGIKFCRHKKMVVEFQKHNRVGQRWLYNIDKNKWIPPFTQEA